MTANTGLKVTSIRIPYPMVLALAVIALVASLLGAATRADLAENEPLMLRMIPSASSLNTIQDGTTMVVYHGR